MSISTTALLRIFFGAVALGFIAFTGHLHIVALDAEEWSSTSGVVTASYVRRTGAGNAGEAGDTDTYSPVVRYEYRVSSEPFVNSRIGFGDYFYNWYSSKSRVRSFPKGSKVTVYYDPQAPGEAALDRAYPSVAIAFLSTIALLCILGAIFLPFLVRMTMDALVPKSRHNA
jgi:Protein of unknown function (DUF3592)